MPADAAASAGRDPVTAGTQAGHVTMHTAEEAARLLKVKRSWLERQAAARKIPFSMLGGSYHFSDRHLAEIIRLNEVAPAPSHRVQRPARSLPDSRRTGDSPGTVAPLRPRPRTSTHHA